MSKWKCVLALIMVAIAFPFCTVTKRRNSNKHLLSATPLNSGVVTIPAYLKLDSFYKKYINAGGIPIVSSGKVPDKALVEARNIVVCMLAKITAVIPVMNRYKVHIAIMAVSELTTDIPEHRDLNQAFPGTDWNIRGRGFGATVARPVTTCAEENLLCYMTDRYRGENILVHEFAHTIHTLGLRYLYPAFDAELRHIYDAAKKGGLWADTYAITNPEEYFAEGVQDWFNVNTAAAHADGVHNEISTRQKLKKYDPGLYAFIARYFYDSEEKIGCQNN